MFEFYKTFLFFLIQNLYDFCVMKGGAEIAAD